MKLFFTFSFIVFYSAALAQAAKEVTITNPGNIDRKDELIVFTRSQLEKKLGPIDKFIKVKAGGKQLIAQHDDITGDGKWDEVSILYSFKPNEKLKFHIAKTNTSNSGTTTQRAHVRLIKKNPGDSWGKSITKEEMPLRNPATDFSKQPLPLYLTEGPAWENDKVGFRLYFDVRNGKDIWGKRTPRMVLDSVGTTVKPTYHDLHDWGMDVLHVGKSLGAGALALLVPLSQDKDTLIRLGGENVQHTIYKQLADGPLRGIFQITYDWTVNGKPVRITEQTSIWGGQYFYESRVWVSGAPKGAGLVSGIASFYDNVFRAYQLNKTNILFSYGQQSENKDYLGMAILVPSNNFSFAGSAPNANSEILNTWLATQDIKDGSPCVFRFIAAWEKSDPRFSQLKLFKSFVDNEAEKMGNELLVTW
ncbi:MAG: DUF4861 domain-containing protein [Flavisolibacter sp.]